ncbi:HflC protein [Liberibacter crescens BT-1]|uniref:Protein HflC n=1 Tax=Liberibacter crescens (strain BT-1) TaxID=1215343 RepID=L0ESX8_LIBCB|nr:protease modulator HflC [Liberibacter crescens]AGA64629.1 HflC protein [Liberibacter crescens BT-1]AMC12743.1 membrane protein [Liberibacter crescens]
MLNRLPAIFIIFLLTASFLLYSSIFIINPREQAIIVRFGKIYSVKTEPGIYFKMPFAFMDADNIQYLPKQVLRLDLDNMRVQVSDGKFYEVDAFVVYRIADARLFRESVSGDRNAAESRLRTRLDSALRRVYGLRKFEVALSKQRSDMMIDVRNDIIGDAEKLGLMIEDVRIRRTDLTQEVSQQTYDRMKAERLAEAEFIRSRGKEKSQRYRSIADREAIEIIADAQRDSEINRGQGDAERTRLFSDAFRRDPAFFDFYRSMKAYINALSSSETSFVLSPNSQFFKYLNVPSESKKPLSLSKFKD